MKCDIFGEIWKHHNCSYFEKGQITIILKYVSQNFRCGVARALHHNILSMDNYHREVTTIKFNMVKAR